MLISDVHFCVECKHSVIINIFSWFVHVFWKCFVLYRHRLLLLFDFYPQLLSVSSSNRYCFCVDTCVFLGFQQLVERTLAGNLRI